MLIIGDLGSMLCFFAGIFTKCSRHTAVKADAEALPSYVTNVVF